MGRVLEHHANVHDARKSVLSAVRQVGNVRQACTRAGVSTTWLYTQLSTRPSFKRRWQKAKAAYVLQEQERQERALYLAALADKKRIWAEARAAMAALDQMYRRDRQFEQRWQRSQERKRRREKQRAQRDAWRTANPNWRQLEREARAGWQRLRAIQAGIVRQEQDPDSELSAWERQHELSARRIQAAMTAPKQQRKGGPSRRRGFDPPEAYDPDC
jgi:hypothetical protein